MPDRIKQIPGKILEIWKKYSKKQKVIIISVTAAILLTLIILILMLNRTRYTELGSFDSVATAKAVASALENAGIAYQVENDNVTILVDETKKTDAIFLVTDPEVIGDQKVSVDKLMDAITDISATSSDKKLIKDMYMQSALEKTINNQVGIEDSTVIYYPKENTYSILESQQEIACTVYLVTNSQFQKSMAETIAISVAAALGNKTPDSIKVIDQYNNLLYNGPEDEEDKYNTKAMEHQKKFEELLKDELTQFALMNNFTDAQIVPKLAFNYDKVTTLIEEYYAADGQEQGLYATYEKMSSENTAASGDIPGTDSNDETDYYIQNNTGGNSSSESEKISYLPSKKTSEITSAWGVFEPEESSMSIVLKRVVKRTEGDLETLGLLEGTTFEEYRLNNSDPVPITLPEELLTAFANASGVPADKISLSGYEIYQFFPNESSGTNWDLYLKILLFALILGMLIFVVFRGMAPVEVTETEPELSIEEMLATTKENQSIDNIEFSDKSETRRMIEKFVEENPEAVANLLRNWLDDGWN